MIIKQELQSCHRTYLTGDDFSNKIIKIVVDPLIVFFGGTGLEIDVYEVGSTTTLGLKKPDSGGDPHE
jgi:hypothetical protein